jgi:hypothetical protein
VRYCYRRARAARAPDAFARDLDTVGTTRL